jgi:hypothetical protein
LVTVSSFEKPLKYEAKLIQSLFKGFRVFVNRIGNILKVVKNWPKSMKKLRLTTLLFARFSALFQLF